MGLPGVLTLIVGCYPASNSGKCRVIPIPAPTNEKTHNHLVFSTKTSS